MKAEKKEKLKKEARSRCATMHLRFDDSRMVGFLCKDV